MNAKALREVLHYNAADGTFTWKVNRAGRFLKGSVAGWESVEGYIHIGVFGKSYLAHRLAWLYEKGEWPRDEIDHINGVKGDNRLENLREATKLENAQNLRRPRADNSHGYMGVSFHARDNLWLARLTTKGKTVAVGYFKTPKEAHEAYLRAKAAAHPFQTLVKAEGPG